MNSRGLKGVSLAAGAGYLLGSVPWADLAARRAAAGRVDLHRDGSGNPGALNAIGVLGKKWGVAIGVADVAKGVLASAVGRALGGDVGAHVGGTAAVVGHCYPVWNGFRGGKGVACACGQCLANFPVVMPFEIAAGAVGMLGPFKRRSDTVTVFLATTWVTAGTVWWLRRGSNAWGPEPTIALPISAAVSSAVVLHRFAKR